MYYAYQIERFCFNRYTLLHYLTLSMYPIEIQYTKHGIKCMYYMMSFSRNYVRKIGESMIKHGSSHMMSINTVHIVAVFIYSYLSLCRFYTDIMMIKYKCVIYVLFSVQCALLESPSLGCDKVCQLNTITLSPLHQVRLKMICCDHNANT